MLNYKAIPKGLFSSIRRANYVKVLAMKYCRIIISEAMPIQQIH